MDGSVSQMEESVKLSGLMLLQIPGMDQLLQGLPRNRNQPLATILVSNRPIADPIQIASAIPSKAPCNSPVDRELLLQQLDMALPKQSAPTQFSRSPAGCIQPLGAASVFWEN